MRNITCIISSFVILPILALYSLYWTEKEKHFHTLKTLNPILGIRVVIYVKEMLTYSVHIATVNLPTTKY
jgi:hypothetical protein